MKKRLIGFVAVLVFMCSITIAQAVEAGSTNAVPSLTFSGTTAHCAVTISNFGKTITASISLWEGNIFIASWHGTDTSVLHLSGTKTVIRGKTYTLRLSGLINGQSISAISVSGTC